MLPFIIIGLTSGSVYAMGAVGLVLTYKTSRVFNFAYGAIATTAAYAFYALHDQAGVNWPLSAAISVLAVGILLGLVFEPLARALASASLAMSVAATVGIVIFVQALFTVLYGSSARIYPPFLPTHQYQIGGAAVGVDQLIVIGLGLGLTVALYVFFRRARTGVAMRGMVDNSELLDLAGTSPKYVRRVAWIIGCTFASLSGVLIAPSLNLDASILTLLIVGTFGAAAIGGFSSLPLTYVGGLLIGVVASVLTKYVVTGSTILAGIPSSLPFLALFGVMLLIPRHWLAAPTRIVPVRPAWTGPWRIQVVAGIVLVVFLVFVPSLSGFRLVQWTSTLTNVILFLSLGLLVRSSGQVSLCQLSFAAIGAAALPHLVTHGIPWLAALIIAGLIAVPVGAMLAIPSIRLGGVYLALATFGFTVLLQQMFYSSWLMFGTGGLTEPRPELGWVNVSSDKGYYYVVLICAVVTTLAVVALTSTRLGRLMRAMADSPLALATNGTSVSTTRVLVFSISAFLAAISGGLYGATNNYLTGSTFTPLASLTLVALIVITVGGAPWYAILSAIGLSLVPAYISNGNVSYYLQMFFGISAVGVAISGFPVLPPRLLRAIDRIGGRKPKHTDVTAAHEIAARASTAKVQPTELQLRNLHVQFGGLVAVEDLSMTVPSGRITGLIGPNGAGKTTTFNACTGLIRPSRGHVLVDGHDVTTWSSARRARAGLGRTFQQIELFDSFTVAENVALGREASLAGSNPARHIISRRADGAEIKEAVAGAIELCGITGLADVPAGSLSTGQRRLVEFARCLAGSYKILLLDEPSSGLDRAETKNFGEILVMTVEERGIGILLVEHDMALVMEVCERIHVLDFGTKLFEGTPTEVTHSPVVQAAYLGEVAEREAEPTS